MGIKDRTGGSIDADAASLPRDAAKSMGRREFVALGALGIGALAVGGLAGCAGPAQDSGQAPSTEGSGNQEAQEAADNWDDAYTAAQDDWDSLQATISTATSKLNEFNSAGVTNPDALSAFEQKLTDAKSVANQHAGIEKPEEVSALRDSIEKLKGISSTYQQAESALQTSQNAVKPLDPAHGEFNLTDKDGYSYHVNYSISPTISIDSTEGKPGQAAVYIDVSNCKVTVKNTTAGKKAPGIMFACAPLYKIDLFTNIVDHPAYCFATFGPLDNPAKYSDIKANYPDSLHYDSLYVNPHDNDPDYQSNFSDLGYLGTVLGHTEFQAGVSGSSSDSAISSGQDFGVNETRDLGMGFRYYSSSTKKLKIGEVNESCTDLIKKISGWAIAPMGGLYGFTYSDDTLLYFVGSTNKASDSGDTWFLCAYNPVAGS